MSKFIFDEFENVIGVSDEEFVKRYFITVNSEYFELLVTAEQNYYNFYVICETYQKEPLNCLKQQIPKEVGEECYNDMECETMLLEFYLWHKFYGFNGNLNMFTIAHMEEKL